MSNHATISLFDQEPYERTFKAIILDARDDLLALDRTMFYPAGGGQPGDSGTLRLKAGSVRVVETFRDEVNRSLIWHRVTMPIEGGVIGDAVDGAIDWEQRYDTNVLESKFTSMR